MSRLFTESYWGMLWRSAVLVIFYHRCALCGDPTISHLEVHHVVPRRVKLLRWDPYNGVPVCRVVTRYNEHKWNGMTCHQYAATRKGRALIDAMVQRTYLDEMEQIPFKEFLVQHNISEPEFERLQMKKLKEVIRGSTNN